MKIIHQGKSGRKYFLIVRPIPDPKQVKPGDQLLLRHPKSKTECTVTVSNDYWWDLSWEEVANSMCMLDFGLQRDQLRAYLEKEYLEFRGVPKVKFMMVEETKQPEKNNA